ncbi:hypothetical protein MtrunA17_Chr8g0392401 [Medicago truncatula]|uniref:Uncharacterized protein n=1 Tax=Medicago truncatula TaxID=3880 RepID=A0A396GYY3_MEDTR|nr:hypothetical protein MtrunA17_Chr8g0392401 [Medicago truncatula]
MVALNMQVCIVGVGADCEEENKFYLGRRVCIPINHSRACFAPDRTEG